MRNRGLSPITLSNWDITDNRIDPLVYWTSGVNPSAPDNANPTGLAADGVTVVPVATGLYVYAIPVSDYNANGQIETPDYTRSESAGFIHEGRSSVLAVGVNTPHTQPLTLRITFSERPQGLTASALRGIQSTPSWEGRPINKPLFSFLLTVVAWIALFASATGVAGSADGQQHLRLVDEQAPPWPKVVKRLSPQDFVEVPRKQLPLGVRAFGEGGEPNWLKTANPRIARFDLNGDGDPELIVAHTYWLSAKGVFHEVYQKSGDTYERIGDLDAVSDVKFLEVVNGFNQIEAWVSGDGERPTYARLLWHYEGKEYRLVRADDFRTNESGKRVYSGTRSF